MVDVNVPDQPSVASLTKALAIAFVIAAVLLVLVVLPAERNIDITGFGKAVGLTALSSAALDATEQASADEPTMPEARIDDQVEIEVPAGRGLEYKFYVREGQKLTFAWSTSGGELYYDFHGEPKGAAKDVFESFAAGNSAGVEGTLTAPFEGTQGWYWQNKGSEPIAVTLVTSGTYEVLGRR